MKRLFVRLFVFFTASILVTMLGVNIAVTRDVPLSQVSDGEGTHRYFAYGSNMLLSYLGNVRGVRPLSSAAATVDGYELVFDLKGPNFIEPAFANLSPKSGHKVEGVVYGLTEEDYLKILGSESSYQVIEIDLMVGNKIVTAKTLMGKTGKEGVPSRRYHEILINGARMNNLSQEYIRDLESHENVYYPVLSELMGVVVHLFVMFKAK